MIRAKRGNRHDAQGANQETQIGLALAEIDELQAWRAAYKAFGVKKTSYRSSAERLLKQVQQGRGLPRINSLVDTYNAISARHRMPIGADDLAKVAGPLAFRYARPEDDFFALVERFVIAPRGDYIRYIVYGDPPVPAADVFGPDYTRERNYVAVSDPGFDTYASRQAGIVLGVTLDGPAHRVGVRDGMEFVNVQASREADQPVKLTVRVGGREETIEYKATWVDVGFGRYIRARHE